MVFNPKFSITPKMNSALIEIERVRGFLDAISINDEWIKDIQREALIHEAHYSTHIEGTLLDLEQARGIIEGQDVPGVRGNDKKELLNYFNTMDFISKYLGKDVPVSEGLVRELHKCIVKGVRGGSADPGNYRKVQNYVVNSKTKEVIYEPPPPFEVPGLMRDLSTWINGEKEISPVIAAGIAQFQLVHIHPFLDGNGRTARILSTLVLYKTGYDFKRLFRISEYYDKNRTAYYRAIQAVRDNEMDYTVWLEYFVAGLKSQMEDIRKKGRNVIAAENILKSPEISELNARQKQIIKHVIVHENINNSKAQEICGSIKRTATRDLSLLTGKGFLEKEGEKRGVFYSLSSKLKSKIRDIKGH